MIAGLAPPVPARLSRQSTITLLCALPSATKEECVQHPNTDAPPHSPQSAPSHRHPCQTPCTHGTASFVSICFRSVRPAHCLPTMLLSLCSLVYNALPHLSPKALASLFVPLTVSSLSPSHLSLTVLWLPSADLWQGGHNQQLHSLPCSHYAVGKEAVDLAFDHLCKLAD